MEVLNIYMLTEEEEIVVRNLAYGETPSAVDAQGILALVKDEVLAKHTEVYPATTAIDQALNEALAAQNGSLALYPNPAVGEQVTALFNTTTTGSKKIRVYNYVGELVAEVAITEGLQTGEVVLSADLFETGLYVVHLVVGEQTVATQTLSFVQ